MSDLWNNVGGDLTAYGDEWLYRKGREVHGPVPIEVIAEKLANGVLDLKTEVAREGGEFHPIGQIKAFAPHIERAGKAIKKRSAKATRRAIFIVFLMFGAIASAGGYYFKVRTEENARLRKAESMALDAQRKAEAAKLNAFLKEKDNIDLVEIVSFDVNAMKVGNTTERKAKSRRKTRGKKDNEPPPMVSSCQRSQQEIFGVLGKNIRKINVCVQDEKQRDTQGLMPSTISLEFIVKPDGNTTEFEVGHRHYRTGPMRNCLLKVFRLMRFPSAGGSNCPVSIPIKIGG
ncbi:MAG: hypothetical protein R3C68_04795 [Myxococcota bacterium]